MAKEFLFRFMGNMPYGKFEFTCVCGEYNSGLVIPANQIEARFTCKNCGAEIIVWEQERHWHMRILPV